ncbi:MAG TPA: PAS domain S-box protein, partial [Syntrophales bacterium]|nr:PAS domain S-box protein [Syntrophales bacterium]
MGHSVEESDKKRFLLDLFSKPGAPPVLVFILLSAILYGAGPEFRSTTFVFEPPWLLFTLNTVFITALCLLIAWLCFRFFLRGGFLNVLLLGSGVFAFGLSSFAAGWLIRPPFGPNYTVTIHNIGVLCAAVLFFLSSLFTAFGFSMEIERRRSQIAVMAYATVFGLGAFLTTETVFQSLPPFFVVGEGPTVIRQVVLSNSVTLLLTSALLMMTVYAERKTGFLLYSINALLLIGTGIAGVALAVPGSPLSWLGRASQYLGDVYLVIAVHRALSEAKARGTTVETALADFFKKSETHYRALVEMAADAIVAIDREGRILLMNPAAEEIFGYGKTEARGKYLEELIVPEQSRDPFHSCLSGESHRDMEMELTRKDGFVFPAELSFSPQMKSDGGSERTIIIHDVTERRRAEEALRESESRFRTLAGATFEGVAVTEEGRLADINEQFCAISGFDRSELLGMDVSKLVHPDDRDRVLDNILTGRESLVEHRMIRKDGSLITVEAHGKTVRHDGRDRRLTAVRDVTEARKAEEAVRSAALFPLQNPSPVLRIHRDGTLLFSNSAAELILAMWRDESGYVIPARVRLAVEAALNEGVSQELDIQTARKVFSFVIAPVSAGVYANLYGRDVTERKRAEEALRRSEARYRSYIEVTGQMGWTTNADGEIAEDIPNWREYTGQSFDEMRGWGWSGALHSDDREITLAVWRKAVEEKRGYETEYRLRRHDGVYRHFLARGVPVFQDDGNVREWVGTCIDITDRRQAEDALRQSESRFRLLSGTAGRLLATDNPQGLINELCRDVMKHLDCQAFFNFMVDEASGRLHLNACAGIPEEEVRKLEWLDYGVAVCGCVARDKVRIVAEDIF